MNDFTFLLFTTQKYSSFNPPYFPKRTLKFFLNSIPACSARQKNPLFTREKSGLRNEKNHQLSQSMDKVQNYTATFLNTEFTDRNNFKGSY